MAGGSSKWMSEKALAKLRQMPRVAIYNLRPPPLNNSGTEGWREPRKHGRSGTGGKEHDCLKRPNNIYQNRIGFEAFRTPMAYKTKREPSYNYGWE